MGLLLQKILRITHAGSHKYDKVQDMYKRKVILCGGNGSNKKFSVKVPRLGPPRSILEPVMRQIEAKLGVQSTDRGKWARGLPTVRLSSRRHSSRRPRLYSSRRPRQRRDATACRVRRWQDALPDGVLLQRDWLWQLPVDDRRPAQPLQARHGGALTYARDWVPLRQPEGVLKVIGDNDMEQIRAAILHDQAGTTIPVELQSGRIVHICPAVHVTLDTGALRKFENRAGSGWCSCCRDDALQRTLARPNNVAEMLQLCKACHAPEPMMQYTLAHEPWPGEHLPRPCPRCHCCPNESTAACEYKEEAEMREELQADDSKAGRAKYARWQTERAKRHLNIRAGPEGLSVLRQATRRSHLCHHHVARLNLPKAPWKWGLLMNLSDDGREKVQGTLTEYGFFLDLWAKQNGRDGSKKFFSGEAWDGLCCGDKNSPGGPKAIAEFLLIMLEDLRTRGVTMGAMSGDEMDPAPIPAPAPAQTIASRRSARIARPAMAAPAASSSVARGKYELSNTLSFVERHFNAAHPGATDLLKQRYGSRANTAIRAALAFDAYFSWCCAWKKKSPRCHAGCQGGARAGEHAVGGGYARNVRESLPLSARVLHAAHGHL